jgi:hypothetical protein
LLGSHGADAVMVSFRSNFKHCSRLLYSQEGMFDFRIDGGERGGAQ